ncbi:aminotransferase DegT [Candidatus Woesearchaeota archaeon]|nr:aminotransferase DegT [Candidatus Woesearchaeota archaeon]
MIPVCKPTLNGNELEYAIDCIKSNWISSKGSYVKKFEEGFSKFCDTKYGVSCSNGTAAIHLALASLGIKEGDEVITPTFNIISGANSIILCGAKPVLVDSELDTWNIDVNQIERKITNRTKAIMVVHTYGHPVDMDPVINLAKKYNLKVIEDSAEAPGALYKNKKVGSMGDVSCFSFYSNKIITTGEGGMIITNDAKIAEKARSMRDLCFGQPRFIHHEFGFNYRLTNIQCAIGLAQLEKAGELINCRISNAKYYSSKLKNVEGVTLPPEKPWAKNVYWMYSLLVEDAFGISKDEVMTKLKELGVETRSFFMPMHMQPLFKDNDDRRYPDCSGEFPISEELYRKGFYLPSTSDLTKEEIDEVVDKFLSLKQ